jgi:dienelactone hydrolase
MNLENAIFLLATATLLLACRPVTRPAATPEPQITTPTQAAAAVEPVAFTNGAISLAGGLTLPQGEGPHPVVVTITGSGPQDRDNAATELPKYRPYRQLAEALAQAGIATLQYDDRGVGQSTGDITTATAAELATDVDAALAYLVARPDIDGKRIALLGHSEGATVAALVAAHRPDIAAVVALSGPALSGAAMQEQILQALDPVIAEQETEALRLVQNGAWQALEDHLAAAILAQLLLMPPEGQAAIGDLEAAARAQAAISVEQVYRNPRYLFTMTHDPADDWGRVHVPVLALYAQHDDLVSAEQNQPFLEAALLAGGNEDFTIDVISGVNHLFLPSAAGVTPDQWANLPQELPSEVVDTIAGWLSQQLE